MVDVKAINAVTDSKSTTRCYISEALQSEINNLEAMVKREESKNWYDKIEFSPKSSELVLVVLQFYCSAPCRHDSLVR